ncbi:DEAD/DEAH box helicase [Acanthopleuribacter pedis]|uniref:ATP-dependent RNA helicase DeaD n=1 Tax=Acanthopleuribacter pedis TaxID=442870 RepID=A0A8J7U6F2_9BACT|nr:DEAD/DEAH box helicase [Acanthopleuribacter pedis]MBO1321854.1 DEAD/DEAH box helicase [Acanthopleuribacter pedis]
MNEQQEKAVTFADLGLDTQLLKALDAVGYETPSPIQAKIIPYVTAGKDVIGQAQTGTGKTAAFALPVLSNLDLSAKYPQVLVLAPTRELAIQVAEAFHRYAINMKGFQVLPIYGGQAYEGQLRHLKRGVHVVVGTPGRVMDHMRRGTLDVSRLSSLVLDEADEMLRMGFIDDVTWILEQTPETRQIALFSATMPREIRTIATKHLKDPEEITIKVKTATAETIRQRYWVVSGLHKLDALTRILEVETFDGMMVFVRTKTAATEIAEKLQARGFAASALNGDIPQKERERRVERLKSGQLDIVVATDVAARGLDVDRISHVINYDIPHDTEAYVHRIGRTGRAGRKGEAILFVSPRERHLLRAIERATRKQIDRMKMPTTEAVNDKRVERFTDKIAETLADADLDQLREILTKFVEENNRKATAPVEPDLEETEAHEGDAEDAETREGEFADPDLGEADEVQKPAEISLLDVAAALAHMVHGDRPLLLEADRAAARFDLPDLPPPREGRGPRGRRSRGPEVGMARYKIMVGHAHGVKPGQIVGAIANEIGLDSAYIGNIDIFNDFSTVDLPEQMPRDVLRHLKKVNVAGQALRISRYEGGPPPRQGRPRMDGARPPGRGKRSLDRRQPRKPKGKNRP